MIWGTLLISGFWHITNPNTPEREKYMTNYLTGNGCLVLCYHKILPSNPYPFGKSVFLLKNNQDTESTVFSLFSDDFEKQITCLKKNNVHFITMKQLEHFINGKISLPAKSVLLTFDDVDESFYKNAYPVLKRYNIPFTLFIITGKVGTDYEGLNLCTWSQIREMANSGLACIGSHSHNFHYLDETDNPALLNPQNSKNFKHDISLSIQTIRKKLGFSPICFAYPYGFGTPTTDNIILDAGIPLIFSLKPGIVKSDCPGFFIPRVLGTQDNWPLIQAWIKQ